MAHWKKSLYIIWFAEMLAVTGFSFVTPFFPYYIQELGIKDLKEVALWAGLLGTAASLAVVISAPLWGMLADKWGRKLMLAKGMLGGCLILLIMGFVRTVEQLLVLRFIQGLLTGTVIASVALVASITPKKHSGYGHGMIQMSIFSGAALGPWLGGIASDYWGYRNSFFASAVIVGIAFIIVSLFVKEDFELPGVVVKPGKNPGSNFLKNKFVLLFTILFVAQLAITLIVPVFPLFVQELVASTKGLASTTGSILALAAAFAAVSAIIAGKMSDKFGYQNILTGMLIGAGIFAAAQFLSRTTCSLSVTRIAFGFFIGGICPLLYSVIHQRTEKQDSGKIFGIAGSMTSLGAGTGPIIGGVFASLFSIQTPFMLCAIIFLLLGSIMIAVFRSGGNGNEANKQTV